MLCGIPWSSNPEPQLAGQPVGTRHGPQVTNLSPSPLVCCICAAPAAGVRGDTFLSQLYRADTLREATTLTSATGYRTCALTAADRCRAHTQGRANLLGSGSAPPGSPPAPVTRPSRAKPNAAEVVRAGTPAGQAGSAQGTRERSGDLDRLHVPAYRASMRYAFIGAAAFGACVALPEPQRLHEAEGVAAARWRVPGSRPTVLGDRLVARVEETWVELDPQTGARLRELPSQSAGGPLDYMADASADDVLVARENGPWLVGLDAGSGMQRWRARCANIESYCDLQGRRVANRLIFLGKTTYNRESWTIGLFALDAHTGQELWRQPTPLRSLYNTHIATDGGRVFVMGHDRLMAWGADGVSLWERPRTAEHTLQHSGNVLVANNGLVAFVDVGHVRVLDAGTGAVKSDMHWTGGAELALSDGILYTASDSSAKVIQIIASDARSGRVLWIARGDGILASPIQVCGPTLILRTSHSDDRLRMSEAAEIAAVRRSDGRTLWRYPLGVNRSAPVARNLVIADSYTDGVQHLVGLTTFAGPHNQAFATITGSIVGTDRSTSLGGLRVRIGDQVTKTDEKGRFEGRVPALGVVTVVLLDRPPGLSRCQAARTARVWIEGLAHDTVDLAITALRHCAVDY